MGIALVSLIILVLVIFIGFFRKINVGLVAILAVTIFGTFGPGCVPALGIVAALSLPLGKSTGYDPVMLAIIGEIGSFTGRFSPITPESLLIQKLTEPQGITNYQSIILIYASVTTIISWSTLLMITGFGMLMDIVILVGGVSLLSDSLAKIMTPHTAVAIQGLTGGIMSWFSSAIGVVWPTLVPTVGNIANSVGVPADSLISILCLTASFAGLSPASTGGGLIMAANATDPDFTKEKENKLFIKLFAVLMVVLIVIAALFGLYSIL